MIKVQKSVVLKITLIILFCFYLLIPTISKAQNVDDLDNQLKQKQDEIKKLESQLDETRSQKKTLQNQLNFIDGQTTLTNLKIQQAKYQILRLEREITDLQGRINRLSTSVDTLSEILLERIIRTYKYSNITTLDLLFSSHGISDLLEHIKYMQVLQANDKKILYQLQATKAAYNDQQSDRKIRQVQQQKLKVDLEVYQNQLSEQKQAKSELLRITQNDEVKYQSLIKQLQAEVASITQAIANVGPSIGSVSKGQRIASMGSTGCSTGPHLHFEVFDNAKVEEGKIVGTRTNPHNYLDNGHLDPPIAGYPSDTQITTEYGEIYFLGTHTGLDIAPKDYEGVGRAILASDKGTAYSVSAPCSYNISGGSAVGKGVIVDHENGVVTLYWHIL